MNSFDSLNNRGEVDNGQLLYSRCEMEAFWSEIGDRHAFPFKKCAYLRDRLLDAIFKTMIPTALSTIAIVISVLTLALKVGVCQSAGEEARQDRSSETTDASMLDEAIP